MVNSHSNETKFIDCTLRDGGYYNAWDFSSNLIWSYLESMMLAGVNVVELGFRSTLNHGFKGACAFTTDEFLETLNISPHLDIAVMINVSELVSIDGTEYEATLTQLFPKVASQSPVDIVRIACHIHEFTHALPAAEWLKEKGYVVCLNLMQVADRNQEEIEAIALEASRSPIDVLYFADSMGSMKPEQIGNIVNWLRKHWRGDLGIHTHDSMGLALQNTMRAMDEGVIWVDSTVTGMGRGPGNVRTEQLSIEIAERRKSPINLVPLMRLIREYFRPMQMEFGWGTNTYYYLAGKLGIHPSYIQEMLNDSRFDDEDILAVIDHLQQEGGKKFSIDTLDAARHFYQGDPAGRWAPESMIEGRDVLLLGAGPGVALHRQALESYIRKYKPIVMALNTQGKIDPLLIDVRIASHPVRLLADCETHNNLSQPLITPYSMLPEDVQASLKRDNILDYGIQVQADTFIFERTYCITPTPLVVAYALAVATSGKANRVLLAGFDGYNDDDPRTKEMDDLLECYIRSQGAVEIAAITPSKYKMDQKSVYFG